ncbi:uncharacterized protein LOC119371657 isoform X1 [Rhipicephalus sanguineus]|uniref:uncharacterized protein LOC119371657 isoform X1 n=1 Tax=Rhipicephalus sanguineus TaxID=34632 RepID=UPI001892D8D1|nr:uncharacterized protein LOC119371657 isoform X1 [Rhipicephalus sanguineus]XP_049275710.1 uncharacterized protein LOC119371657 isoform X2 [Rhipicephalus sanguineus]XP_049275711.1 uncharacterized protein LOC119371657 isoform X3 [Rhipicephalus sanguineus]XP_049275712.1 uncharacterized protein LOC119371657 isoform X1 [Rhipicephalus sanguineus]
MKLDNSVLAVLASIMSLMANVECTFDTHQWVYLENVAAMYIKKMNETYKGRVGFWGLTKSFVYWKHPYHDHKRPVEGTVDWTEYSKCKGKHNLRETETDCTGLFTWKIHKGISCPFPLSTTALLPEKYKGLSLRLFSFNVSGLTKVSDQERWGKPTYRPHRTFYEICKFRVKVEFSGYFVYMLLNPNEGNFKWVLVDITSLAGSARGLRKEGSKLTYMARGQYIEQIFCNERNKKGP